MNQIQLIAALPFFSDPAALALLLFGIAVVVVTIAFCVYFLVVKKKNSAT